MSDVPIHWELNLQCEEVFSKRIFNSHFSQGKAGVCWAMSVLLAVSVKAKALDADYPVLSLAYILDHCRPPRFWASCLGGVIHDVLRMVRDLGVAAHKDYPRHWVAGRCMEHYSTEPGDPPHFPPPGEFFPRLPRVYRPIKGFYRLRNNPHAYDKALREAPIVFVVRLTDLRNISCTDLAARYFTEFDSACPPEVEPHWHAMCITGSSPGSAKDVDAKLAEPHYVVRNSYGHKYNHEGYLYIKKADVTRVSFAYGLK